jgi:hypothetical protein
MNNTFKSILEQAPEDLVEYLETLKGIEQNRAWHPEGDVYTHTQVVVDRLAKFNDINLSLAGLFHDTGKDRTTRPNPKTGKPTSPKHEIYSAQTVRVWSKWISSMGANPNLVEDIVRWHMYIKYMDTVKSKHKEIMLNSKLYKNYLSKFTTCDKGGMEI